MIIKARLLKVEGEQPIQAPVVVRAWTRDIPADPRLRAALEVMQPVVEVDWNSLSKTEQDWMLGKGPVSKLSDPAG